MLTHVNNRRRPTADIVTELENRVRAVTLADDAKTPAFQRVERFDVEQLVEAFRYLLVTEQRVCVIVPMDEQFEIVTEKQKLMVKRLLPVALLISDRVLGDRKAALWGSDAEVGASALADLTLPAVIGLLLPNQSQPVPLSGVVAEPHNLQIMSVKDTEQQLPMRVAMALELHCRGGYIEAPMPIGPVF